MMLNPIKILKKIILVLCIMNMNPVLAQDHSNAINFEASYIGDFATNFSGGLKTGSAYLGKMDIMFTFSTEHAGLWKNGEIFANIQNTHGGAPTADLVGDLQVLSNIENGHQTYLYQFWFQQSIQDFSILFGVHDLNSEFDANDYCSVFLNSSFGIMPDISMNVPSPIFPKNALGLMLSYDISRNFSFKTALYDGDPGNLDDDPYNMNLSISAQQGFLSINEFTVKYFDEDHQKGTYALGAYYHSADFPQISDSATVYHGNYGIYFIGSQSLFSENEENSQGLNLFLQAGWAPEERNFSKLYLGIGLNYTGLFPGREEDVMGLAAGYLSLSKDYIQTSQANPLASETAIELTYLFYINDKIAIQPDFQYIIHPGANRDLKNAWVGLFRTSISF